jgi:hypothetical protein
MRIIIEIDEPDRVSTVVQGRAAQAMAPAAQAGATMQEAAANVAAINAGPAPASVTAPAPARAFEGEGAGTDATAGVAAGNAQSAGAARYEGAFQ